MSKELVVSSNRHETKVAVLEDDQLVEIYFQREQEYSLAGSIHKGRVTRVLPGMQSAFVDIGLFLFFRRDLDVEIVQRLAIHDSHTQLFTLSCVDQHPLHLYVLARSTAKRAAIRASVKRRGIATTVGAQCASAGTLVCGRRDLFAPGR